MFRQLDHIGLLLVEHRPLAVRCEALDDRKEARCTEHGKSPLDGGDVAAHLLPNVFSTRKNPGFVSSAALSLTPVVQVVVNQPHRFGQHPYGDCPGELGPLGLVDFDRLLNRCPAGRRELFSLSDDREARGGMVDRNGGDVEGLACLCGCLVVCVIHAVTYDNGYIPKPCRA